MAVTNKHRAENNPNPRRRNLVGTLRVQKRWVAVAIDPEPEREGLIIVPDNAKNQIKAHRGRIVDIGPGARVQALREDWLQLGRRVLIDWYKAPGGVALDDGVPYLINGESVRFVDVDQVLAVED